MLSIHLAPMKNISCWAYRNSFNNITDSYTEMLNLRSLLSKRPEAWDVVDTYSIENQVQWLQILTHSVDDIKLLPNHIKDFQLNFPEKNHIFGVNINACCPDPSIIAAGDGASLIKRTKRLIDLIKGFLGPPDSHSFHISCKLRLGLNAQEMNYNKIFDFLNNLHIIEDNRLSPPIIHFRHARQSSFSTPHWEFLEKILDANYPIIINGGISSSQDCQAIKTKLSIEYQKLWDKLIIGVMIGQAALKNPLCSNNFMNSSWQSQDDEMLSEWKMRFQQNLILNPPKMRFLKQFEKYFH